jgi:hypothetical protein
VQFVLRSAVRQEASADECLQMTGSGDIPIVLATQFSHHVSQREHCTKDQFGVIIGAESYTRWPSYTVGGGGL